MKTLLISALVATGLAASASGAFADGNPPDFFAIQRGYGYDGSTTPLAPPALPAAQASTVTERVYLPEHRKLTHTGLTRRPPQ